MHHKRGIIFLSLSILAVLLISSLTSAFWPFDSWGKKTITGNAVAVNDNSPVGGVDAITNASDIPPVGALYAIGWAYDKDAYNWTTLVNMYIDGTTLANYIDETADDHQWARVDCNKINSLCHGSDHYFVLPIPSTFYDGVKHTAYLYAINLNSEGAQQGNNLFIKSVDFQYCGATKALGVSCPAPQTAPAPATQASNTNTNTQTTQTAPAPATQASNTNTNTNTQTTQTAPAPPAPVSTTTAPTTTKTSNGLTLTLALSSSSLTPGSSLSVTSTIAGDNLNRQGIERRVVGGNWENIGSWAPVSGQARTTSVPFQTAGTYEIRMYGQNGANDNQRYVYTDPLTLSVGSAAPNTPSTTSTTQTTIATATPSSVITDPSVRGFANNTADASQQLVLGFTSTNNAMLWATMNAATGAANTVTDINKMKTSLYSISSSGNSLVPDSDSTSFGVTPAIPAGTYTFNAYPTNPADQGQTIISTAGAQLDLSQFSARGYINSTNNMILGFTVQGNDSSKIVVRWSNDKLAANGIALEDTSRSFNTVLYDRNNAKVNANPDSGSAIVATYDSLSPGQYTLVISSNDQTAVSSGLALVEVTKISGGKITDPSVRGFAANTADASKQLILGFANNKVASVSAKILDGWAGALSRDKLTLSLNSITTNKQMTDSSTSTFEYQSGLSPGTYTFNVYPIDYHDAAQTVLSNIGNQIDLSQLSARGLVNSNNPLILGFRVASGTTNIKVQADSSKLPASFNPKLDSFNLNLFNSDSSTTPYKALSTNSKLEQEIDGIPAGTYTLVLTTTSQTNSYALLEITKLSSPSASASSANPAVASTQTTTTDSNSASTSASSATSNANQATGASSTSATSTSAAAVSCTYGCLSLNGQNCYQYGYRSDGKFCDVSKQMLTQSITDATCSNNYECSSNLCIDSKCASPGFLQRLFELLQKILGI